MIKKAKEVKIIQHWGTGLGRVTSRLLKRLASKQDRQRAREAHKQAERPEED